MSLEFCALTEEQKKSFRDDGYLVVPEALAQGQVQTLLEASDRVFSSAPSAVRQSSRDRLFDSYRNCFALAPEFTDLLLHHSTFPLVVQLLGPNLQLTTSHLIYRRADPPGAGISLRRPRWHRDIPNTSHDLGHARVPRLQIKCAYYLTDTTVPYSGATLVLPGSHRQEKPPPIGDGSPDPEGAVEVRVRAGDCLMFENRVWHAGGANVSGRIRKSVMVGYGYRWLKPADHQAPSVESLDRLDPIGQFLVSGRTGARNRGRRKPGEDEPNPIRDWCLQEGFTYEPLD